MLENYFILVDCAEVWFLKMLSVLCVHSVCVCLCVGSKQPLGDTNPTPTSLHCLLLCALCELVPCVNLVCVHAVPCVNLVCVHVHVVCLV